VKYNCGKIQDGNLAEVCALYKCFLVLLDLMSRVIIGSVYQSKACIAFDFLLMINGNLGLILHRFRDTAA